MIKRIKLIVSLIGLLVFQSVNAQYSLYVGEPEFIATPDPPNNGWIEGAHWNTSEYISTSEADEYGAIIFPNHYFEGTQYITCTYTFGYYSGNYKRAGQLQENFYITCIPIYATLSQTELAMNVGEKKKLTYTLSDYDSGYYRYAEENAIWHSSNENVVYVDEKGNLEALKAGEVTISLDPVCGSKVFCSVIVKYVAPEKITIVPESVTLVKGKSKNLSYKLEPNEASADVKWTSSDDNIVTVSSKGKITGVAEGSAVITATTDNGLSAKCNVEVVPTATSVELPKTADIYQGYSMTLKPTLYPQGTESSLKWKSDNTDVVYVSKDGVITGRNTGSANVTVTTENGLEASCKITVKQAPQGTDYRNARVRLNIVKELVNETLNNISK